MLPIGFLLVLSALGAQALARAGEPGLALVAERREIEETLRSRVQGEILDRLLGRDKASAFVHADVALETTRFEDQRFGEGAAEKNRVKAGPEPWLFTERRPLVPGVPDRRNIFGRESAAPPEAAQTQSAAQSRVDQKLTFTERLVIKKLEVTVLHDADIPQGRISEARHLIHEAVRRSHPGFRLEDVTFHPANYAHPEKDWWNDLRDPQVYLRLLSALLTLLFLGFLFGPLARFFRRYVEALVRKPAAEINVESKIAPPEASLGTPEESRSHVEMLVGRKPAEPSPPPPPPPPEEDQEAPRANVPFAYVNEGNLGNLANLFLLRAEEPWLVAVVLSYLRPEYARQVLTSLPVELQAKVALEALKVRQVTKEQILAIDADIKENIDYVVGGIERLIQMLEEADSRTRANILDCLQNDKPVVFEYVRKQILLFEDVVRFPDREMQAIVRELKAPQMAKALHGSSPEVANKFFSNMSAGAAALVKEAMEFQRDITAASVEEERARIMEHVKALEKLGRISIRGGEEAGGFHQVIATGSAQGTRSLGGADFDGLVEACSAAGETLYQLGRYSESIAVYESLLRLRPDPELRAWVEGVRASVAGANYPRG